MPNFRICIASCCSICFLEIATELFIFDLSFKDFIKWWIKFNYFIETRLTYIVSLSNFELCLIKIVLILFFLLLGNRGFEILFPLKLFLFLHSLSIKVSNKISEKNNEIFIKTISEAYYFRCWKYSIGIDNLIFSIIDKFYSIILQFNEMFLLRKFFRFSSFNQDRWSNVLILRLLFLFFRIFLNAWFFSHNKRV